MKETKIIVTIKKDGSISSETKGIKGQNCVAELDNLFKDIAKFDSYLNTSDYYEQSQEEVIISTIKRGRSNE